MAAQKDVRYFPSRVEGSILLFRPSYFYAKLKRIHDRSSKLYVCKICPEVFCSYEISMLSKIRHTGRGMYVG